MQIFPLQKASTYYNWKFKRNWVQKFHCAQMKRKYNLHWDFPATTRVCVWFSCIHPCLDCLSRRVRMVYKHCILIKWLRQFRHEWVQEIHTHTRPVAGKSFPNVLTVWEISFSYSNSSNTTIIKKLCKSKKLVKSQSGHTEKPFAGH